MTELLIKYITEWAHHYVVHLGAWITFIIAATVYKDGCPDSFKAIRQLVVGAAVLGAIVAVVSSHSHMHYIKYLLK